MPVVVKRLPPRPVFDPVRTPTAPVLLDLTSLFEIHEAMPATKQALRLEIRGHAFDLPIAVAHRVETATAGDFLRRAACHVLAFRAPGRGLGERPLGGRRERPSRILTRRPVRRILSGVGPKGIPSLVTVMRL